VLRLHFPDEPHRALDVHHSASITQLQRTRRVRA
jgi:ABC-type hemin transport system ATPase subunit